MNDPLDLIAQTPIFRGLAATELEQLRAATRTRRFERNSYLFREGDPGSHLIIVVRGEIKIAHVSEGGAEVVFAIAGPGGVLGELSIFEKDGLRTADAQALDTAECLIIARGPLIEFLSIRPALLLHIISTLCSYIKRKDAALGEVSFLDIPGRVALKLIELAASKGRPTSTGIVIDVPLSQRTLAGMVGASRENVNRALSRFADLGYIRQSRGRIEVLDREQLRRRGSSPL
jgi:CRP/FNR family transcriptional regulator, cyclic AMP receptor protein